MSAGAGGGVATGGASAAGGDVDGSADGGLGARLAEASASALRVDDIGDFDEPI